MDSHECPATKCCSKCKTEKAASDFYKNKSRLTSHCKSCYAIASKRTYEANREKRLVQCAERRKAKAPAIKQYMADYYARNLDKVLERTKAYQAKPEVQERDKQRHAKRWIDNRDALLVKRKERLDDPEVKQAWLAYLKDHYRANKSAYLAKWAKRRAQKIQATPKWADLKAIDAIYADAAKMTEKTGIQYEVDHIVPLQGKTVCGLHVGWNLQVITRKANRSKSNSWLEI